MFFLEEPRCEPERFPTFVNKKPINSWFQAFLTSLATFLQGSPTNVAAIARNSKLFAQLTVRKIYVWKILSVRKKWYEVRNGGFYNPKLKATVYPTWECSWNLSRSTENYRGINSKETAQEVAFKLWMKKRRLKNRLGMSEIQFSVPINIGQKVLPNKVYIRKASPKDTPLILNLLDNLGSQPIDDKMETRIQAYAYGTNSHIILAEKRKKVVGFIAFVIYDLFVSEGKRCHIEELIVHGDASDIFIKRKLLQAVEDFARGQNGKIIDLTIGSYPANDASNDFYKFMGYENNSITAKTYLKKEL